MHEAATQHTTPIRDDQTRREKVWTDHDRLPDDGAWLYVVDAAAYDAGTERGAWVPADLDDHRVAMVVSSAAGEALARWDLAVIDQVGLDEMVDEDQHHPRERAR